MKVSFSAGLLFCFLLISLGNAQGTIHIVSDDTCRSWPAEVAGWETISFDDSSWNPPITTPCGGCACSINDILPNSNASFVWDSANLQFAFIRKTFSLSALPALATLRIFADDDYDLYVNGNFVGADHDCWCQGPDTYDVATYLREGQNLIAVKADDCFGGCRWLVFDLECSSPPDSQLEVFNHETGLWVSTPNPAELFNPSYGTAVIVHGWNPDDSLDLPDWTQQMASALSTRLAKQLNILGWNWQKEAQGNFTLDLWGAHSHINDQSRKLATDLNVTMPQNYTGPVQFIGHSLGTILITETAMRALEMGLTQIGRVLPNQITFLDSPDRAELIFLNCINDYFVIDLRKKGVYFDAYYGITGSQKNNVDLWVNLPCVVLQNGWCHGEPIKWYYDSIVGNETITLRKKTSCWSDVLLGAIGFNASILFMADRVQIPECKIGTLKFSKLSICSRISGQEIFGLENHDDCISEAAPTPTSVFSPNVQAGAIDFFDGISWITDGCNCGLTNPTALYLSTDSLFRGKIELVGDELIARYRLNLNVGSDQDYLSFEYEFAKAPVPSTLEVTLITDTDELQFFLATSESTLGQGLLDTGLLNISSLHNQSITLCFALKSASAGSRVNIQNISLWRDPYNGNQPPVANAGNDLIVAVRPDGFAEVALDGTATTDPDGNESLDFRWLYQDGLIASGSQPTTELPIGVYLITLVVTDIAGNTNADEVIVEIQKPFMRGDCEPDNAIDIGDAVCILAHTFFEQPIPCEDACDSNDNGQIDLADAIYLLNYIFTAGLLPPAPFIEKGLDQTPEGLGCHQY